MTGDKRISRNLPEGRDKGFGKQHRVILRINRYVLEYTWRERFLSMPPVYLQQFRIQTVTPYTIMSYENDIFLPFFVNSLCRKELAVLNSELLIWGRKDLT
jgi:hypothetical protein